MSTTFEDVETMYQDYVTPHSSVNDSNFKILDFKWLNIDKPVIANSPALKQPNGSYGFSVHQYKCYGCVHPVTNKSGFFIIRKNGLLEFYYQTLNSAKVEYQKTSIKLNSVHDNGHSHNNNNNDNQSTWLSHASFAFFRDGPVSITTFNPIDSYIRIYKITVNWGYNQQMNKLDPSLVVETIINEQIHKFDSEYNPLLIDKIESLSANFSAEVNLDIIINFRNSNGDNVLLSKYQISNKFVNVTKDHTESVEGFFTLNLVSEVEMPHQIGSITTQNFGFYIMLVIEKDGYNEFQIRSRKNLKLYQTANPNAISTLVDFNFKFPSLPIAPNTKNFICSSPCFSSYASISTNNSELQFHYGVKANSTKFDNEEEMKQISVGLSHIFSSSCYLNSSGDEILPVVQQLLIDNPEHSETFINMLLKECHSSLNFSLDCPKDQIDRIIVSPPIQKLIWLQYALGNYSVNTTKKSISKSLLNLRLTALSVMLTLKTIYQQQQKINKRGTIENVIDSVMRSDTVLSTLGTINWFIEFLVFLVQDLLSLDYDSEHSSIVFWLILSKIPRNLMIYSIAGIKRVESFLVKIEEHNNNIFKQSTNVGQIAPQVEVIKEVLSKSLSNLKRLKDNNIDLDKFEVFLISIENLAQLPESVDGKQRLEIEQDLLIKNKIPQHFQNTSLVNKAKELFYSTYVTQNEDKILDTYTHDTQDLGLSIKPNKIPKSVYTTGKITKPLVINPSKLRDNVTKLQLIFTPAVLNNLKKCNRCGRLTVTNPTLPSSSDHNDITLGPGYSYGDEYHLNGVINGVHSGSWMVAFQRSCICGGIWCRVDKKNVVAVDN